MAHTSAQNSSPNTGCRAGKTGENEDTPKHAGEIVAR